MNHTNRKHYQAMIGLEVHAQLLLQSKMFAPESAAYGALPNTHISTISLAHPGTLPRVNRKAIEQAIRMGLACQATITRENYFARKSYHYPDLPKGYQITQDKTPICQGGYITITTQQGFTKDIHLQSMHLEEDAGKSIHNLVVDKTLVDFNRAGIALLEIITHPYINTPEETYQFLTEIRKLVRYLDICDGNMEEGSLRCDVNVSVMPQGATKQGQKVEIKNMNSIKNVQLAIEHEIARQTSLLEAGEQILAETRSYATLDGQTISQRIKESTLDYRYFPEPDLPLILVEEAWVEQVRANMPPLPKTYYQKFRNSYQLSAYDATVLTESKEIAMFFEALCQQTPYYKAAANWVMGPIKAYLNALNISMQEFPLQLETVVNLIDLVEQDQVSFSIASQQLLPALLEHTTTPPLELARKLDLLQEKDSSTLQELIKEVIATYPDKVSAYRKGKKGILGMLMGEVMKKSRGKAAPKLAINLLKQRLEDLTITS